jgi:hypothetical protein
VGWRRASRAESEPATHGSTSGSRFGGRGKAWSRVRSGSHERDFRLQGQHDNPRTNPERCTGIHHLCGWPEEFRRSRRGWLRTCHSYSAAPLGATKKARNLPAERAVGNLQQWLIGTYHGVSKAQLQVYLDEFVFRNNRRKTPAAAFQTLLGLGTGRKSTEYEQIRGARDLNHNRVSVAEATGSSEVF